MNLSLNNDVHDDEKNACRLSVFGAYSADTKIVILLSFFFALCIRSCRQSAMTKHKQSAVPSLWQALERKEDTRSLDLPKGTTQGHETHSRLTTRECVIYPSYVPLTVNVHVRCLSIRIHSSWHTHTEGGVDPG
jgi:hypothetical protein